MESWNLASGLLKTFLRTIDFNPHTVQQTNAQTSIHIHGLYHEYMRSKNLFKIAVALSNPLTLDKATKKINFDHFAMVLIDVNLILICIKESLQKGIALIFTSLLSTRNFLFSTTHQLIGHTIKNYKDQIPKTSTSCAQIVCG